jgi:hypothetical protein
LIRPVERRLGLPARMFALLAVLLAHLAVFLPDNTSGQKPSVRSSVTVPVTVLAISTFDPKPILQTPEIPPGRTGKSKDSPQRKASVAQPIADSANTSTAVPLQQPQHAAGNDQSSPASKEAARFDGHGPLDLSLPKTTAASQPRSAYEQALDDPRSTSVHLTWDEKFAISMGAIECIFQERLPDGSIYRAPGHLKHLAATGGVGVGGRPVLVPTCVK